MGGLKGISPEIERYASHAASQRTARSRQQSRQREMAKQGDVIAGIEIFISQPSYRCIRHRGVVLWIDQTRSRASQGLYREPIARCAHYWIPCDILQSIEVVYSEKIVAAFLQEQAGSQAYVVVPFIARGAGELDKNYPDYLPGKLMQLQLTLFGGDTNAAKSAITLATDLLNRLSKTAPDRENSPQVLGEIQEKTLLARGTAQMQLKNLAAARQDFELAKQIAPKDPNVYNSLAFLALQENKQEEALAAFDQATQVDATNFAALNGLLTLYARENQLDKGQARVDQLLASNPNSAMLHYFKAQIFRLQKDISSAEAEFRKSLDLDPNYIASYSALGEMFIGAKQEDRAIAEYQKILAIKPDNASVYTLIGMLEDSRKNFDAAEQNYRKALEKDPNSVFAANNLAWLYAMTGRGNLDEALRLAQGVVQKNPNVAGFIDTLGWVYYKKGLFGAAVEQLQKAVALDERASKIGTGNPAPTYHYHLGMALKARGDKAGAKRELEQAVRLSEKAPFSEAGEARNVLASL